MRGEDVEDEVESFDHLRDCRMAAPDDWDQLCKAILAVVESSQGGIPLDVIERDYQ